MAEIFEENRWDVKSHWFKINGKFITAKFAPSECFCGKEEINYIYIFSPSSDQFIRTKRNFVYILESLDWIIDYCTVWFKKSFPFFLHSLLWKDYMYIYTGTHPFKRRGLIWIGLINV